MSTDTDEQPEGERFVTDSDMGDRFEKHHKIMGVLDNNYPIDKVLIWDDGVFLNRQRSNRNWWALMIDGELATIVDCTEINSTKQFEQRVSKLVKKWRSTGDRPTDALH